MTQPSIITIGNFDGVHLGHRAIFATARELADAHDARVVAMTFDPHPYTTLDPTNRPPRLCSLEQKIARLKDAGVDEVEVLEPTPQVLGQTAEDFVNQVEERYNPRAFVEGRDFHFGKDRAGDIPRLKQLGKEYGFQVVIQPSVDITLDDLTVVAVHSSFIRWLVGHGRVEDAQRCLTEPFSITSTVVTGEKRGRTIGFPTINLDLDELDDYMIPTDGVYAGAAHLPGTDQQARRTCPAAISIGNKPSFGKVQLTLEAHLLDFTGDLYGQSVTLEFSHWVRDQMRFPSIDVLCKQLERDIQQVRGVEPIAIP
jgi:riboflavin kinase / FMN adenylyltransferase